MQKEDELIKQNYNFFFFMLDVVWLTEKQYWIPELLVVKLLKSVSTHGR